MKKSLITLILLFSIFPLCVETIGFTTSHILDPNSITIIDGLSYKRCRFCNALVLSNSGGLIPVQGEKPDIELLIYRKEELD